MSSSDLPVGTGWKCLPCVVDRKGAEMGGAPLTQLPELRDAVTMMNGMLVCYEHIQVQRQSPLLAAMPTPTPPVPLEQFRNAMNGH